MAFSSFAFLISSGEISPHLNTRNDRSVIAISIGSHKNEETLCARLNLDVCVYTVPVIEVMNFEAIPELIFPSIVNLPRAVSRAIRMAGFAIFRFRELPLVWISKLVKFVWLKVFRNLIFRRWG